MKAPIIGAIVGSIIVLILILLNPSGPAARENFAVQGVHLLIPGAECSSLQTSNGFFPDSAICRVGTVAKFCRASAQSPLQCVDYGSVAPPQKP